MKQTLLARAARDQGPPVPFRLLSGLRVYAGDFVLLMAAPGVGKSFIALDWAKELASLGEPSWVLYCTTDTPLREQAARMARMYDVKPAELADQVLNLRWSDTDLRGHDELAALIDADVEMMGCNPSMVVVDLALDIKAGDDYSDIINLFAGLKRVAREYKTVLLAVHHITGQALGYGKKKPSLNDALYKVDRSPEVVMGAWRPEKQSIGLVALKNRGGPEVEIVHPFNGAKAAIG